LFYDNTLFATGGYAYLHRNVPLYGFDHLQAPKLTSVASFNAVVLNRSSIPDFATIPGGSEFALRQCYTSAGFANICLMTRHRTCTHEAEMNALLYPGAPLPRDSTLPSDEWTNTSLGRIWYEDEAGWSNVWTRRGDTNIFDVFGCRATICSRTVLSIHRSGNRVLIIRHDGMYVNDITYIGTISGTQVSGWYPHGTWHGTIEY
jgi:hypothetical protein